MDEHQVDSFISEIESEMELIRVSNMEPVVLDSYQEDYIKSLPKEKRQETRERLLKEKIEERKARLALLISSIEDKIASSGLPVETKSELLSTINNTKNTDWKVSTQTMGRIDEIKEKENTKEERIRKEKVDAEKNNEELASVQTAAIAATAAVVVAELITSKPKENKVPKIEETPTFTLKPNKPSILSVAGVYMLSDNVSPERLKKMENVKKKAIQKIGKVSKTVSIEQIKESKNLTPIEKKIAEAVIVEKKPALKKDKEFEAEAEQNKAVLKSIARKQRKTTKKAHPDKGKPQNNPKYQGGEAIAMARVKKIKQSAGTSLTIDEIKERLPVPLRKYYEAVMQKEHPEYYAEQKKAAEKRETIAKIRIQKKLYRRGLTKKENQDENNATAVASRNLNMNLAAMNMRKKTVA